jgi:catechol 2,3-dioxygenase-like lactoylglutathione lyase family enzyme
MRLTLLSAFVALPLLAQVVPPNAAGVSMGHLHIVCSNPEAQKKLWVDVLGGKLITAGPLEYAMFPGVFVGFRKGQSNGGTDGSVIDHLGFVVRDGAAMKAKLQAAGVKIVRDMPENRQFFAMFPDGVKVEFSEDTGLDVPIKHHHIHFATDRVEEMRAWYSKVFNAVPGMRGRFKAADLPGANLSWTPSEKPTLPTKGRALDHIGFEVKDIKAFCQKLEASGMRLDMQPTPRPDLGLTIAFLTDPGGTRVELTEGLPRF